MTEKILKAIAGTPDSPLVIGDIQIPCYVLEDETRVLTQKGFLMAIGRSGKPSGGSKYGFDKLPFFLAPNNLKPFISDELVASTTPVRFQAPHGGTLSFGYKAILLPQVCSVYLEAKAKGVLLANQDHIAKRCQVLLLGFAHVGIIALIDEVTRYQDIRAKNALAKILEDFIDKELQPWSKTFPLEFYRQIFRLKSWSFPELASGKKPKTPQVIWKYTNEVVYKRLAPGVLDELQKLNPITPNGGRKNRHTQWFTPDIGHPKLKEHLAAVMAIMRMSSNWRIFKNNLQKSFPLKGDQKEIDIET